MGFAHSLSVMGERRGYGQFCPISRAAELLSTRWTPLVVRELYFGSTRYSELRRGLPRISSALLSQRLKELEHAGIVTCEPSGSGTGQVYGLTEAGRALFPVLESMGRWAQAHSRDDLTRTENLDPDLLMWNIRRRAVFDGIPTDKRFVVAFHFLGVPSKRSRFWLLYWNRDTEVCIRDPGYDVSLVVTAHIRTLTQVWLGHVSLSDAVARRDILLDGDQEHVQAFKRWFPLSLLATNDQNRSA
ncbi:winged helix-turn-helix transcriptional regulator [Thioclava nitratireducens]|uniref:winged helix-turn-helix transcriptional regulator n=1 Tax=Thioclava nitratireducens TaxID=1915078 RepID=UPI00248060D9|nr:helix-turn-helix domain-containing protein [Thioclava nitratireducens]WGT48632.1 helix-turn-helix domain-containing protein [Thioclava nitratireducens]